MEFKKKSKNFAFGLLSIILIVSLLFLSFVFALGTFPQVNSPATMTAFWHLNNQSAFGENDTRVYDFSGNNANGTVFGGAVWNSTGGYLGDGAFQFDGSNDYITKAGTFSDSNTSATINTWFYSSNATGTQVIAGFGASSSRLSLGLIDQGGTSLRGHCNDNASNLAFPSGGTIAINTWYMATITYAPSSCKIYLNGNLIATSSTATGYLPIQNGGFTIGRWSGYNQNYLNGYVDEVIIYNSTLTANQILNLYQDYTGCNPPSSGNWNYDCSQNCTFNSNYVLDSNITLTGSGKMVINGNFTFNSTNQYIFLNSGCQIQINRGGSFNG